MEACNNKNPYNLESYKEKELSPDEQQEYNDKMEQLRSWKPGDDEFGLKGYEEESLFQEIEEAQEPICDEKNPYNLKTWEETKEEKNPSKNIFSQVKKFFSFLN